MATDTTTTHAAALRRSAGTLLLLLSLTSTSVLAQDRIDLLIEKLERQEQELQALREEVAALKVKVEPTADQPDYYRVDGEEPLNEYLNPGLTFSIAGQVNQAINVADDGESTKGYFVDNDNSVSRIRLAGVATFDNGPQLGSTLEVAFSGNNSFDVSQDNENTSDFLRVRRAEVWLLDERYGRVMFGRGSAATDSIAEFDLSLVAPAVMLSGISFPMGGLQFTDGNSLSGISIADAFFNFDGDRQNRIRYDTPMYGPLQVSASAGSDQRYDLALTFGGDYDHWSGVQRGDFTTIGAIGISDPGEDGVDYRASGSWSVLHNPTGLSLTVSGGYDGGVSGDTPYNLYAKLGWDTRLLRFGPTGFGIDYTYTENVTADGDQGTSVGLAAAQVFDRYGIEAYSQLRWLNLDRANGTEFKDFYVFTTGARVRF